MLLFASDSYFFSPEVFFHHRRKFFVFICFVMLAEYWCFIVHAVRYFGGVFFLIHPKTC